MRKLIVSNIISLDGYFAGPGDDVMALPMDAFFNEQNLERLRAADTLLLGANTYRGFKSYWPPIAENPYLSMGFTNDPDAVELQREIGQRNNRNTKVVVSDSLTEQETAPWTDTTTIVRRADAHRVVTALKDGPGPDILMFGSGILWKDLLTAGLVDELFLMVGAVVIGDGVPAFGPGPVPPLHLLSTLRRPGSNNLLMRYQVDNNPVASAAE